MEQLKQIIMTNKNAISIIKDALTSYVEDSSGIDTPETKEIQLAFNHIQNKLNSDIEEPYYLSGVITDKMYNKALEYTSMEYDTLVRVLNEINDDDTLKDSDMIDTAHKDFQIAEIFEWTFTIKDFFNQIR